MTAINFTTKGGQARLARIREVLAAQPMNTHQIGAALGMTRKWAGQNLGVLHRAGQVHIADWQPWHTETWKLPCYAWGAGEDMPRPAYDQARHHAEWRKRIDADPERREKHLARNRVNRDLSKKAEWFRTWKAENPEAYAERLRKSAEASRKRREAKLIKEAADKIATLEAARERERIEALRAARREAKELPEWQRDRYVAVQTVIRTPRPDPLVGLFFGMTA